MAFRKKKALEAIMQSLEGYKEQDEEEYCRIVSEIAFEFGLYSIRKNRFFLWLKYGRTQNYYRPRALGSDDGKLRAIVKYDGYELPVWKTRSGFQCKQFTPPIGRWKATYAVNEHASWVFSTLQGAVLDAIRQFELKKAFEERTKEEKEEGD